MGYGIGSVVWRGLKVFHYQPRVGVEKVRGCGSFGKLAKDKLDRDSRGTNYGLPMHHSGVNLDTISH